MKRTKLSTKQTQLLINKFSRERDAHIRAFELSERLKELGADWYDLHLPETATLPALLKKHETVDGVIFGKYNQQDKDIHGRGALVLTSSRLLTVDKKPLFLRYNELSHESISGVSYAKVGFAGTLTLYTRFGIIRVRTFNDTTARNFVNATERILFREKTDSPAITDEPFSHQTTETHNLEGKK